MVTSYVIAALSSSNMQQNSGEKAFYQYFIYTDTNRRMRKRKIDSLLSLSSYFIWSFRSHRIQKVLGLVGRKRNVKRERGRVNRNILFYLKTIQDEKREAIAGAWGYDNAPVHLAVRTLLCPHILLLSSRFFVACRNEG